jgi:hypothetical protein
MEVYKQFKLTLTRAGTAVAASERKEQQAWMATDGIQQ